MDRNHIKTINGWKITRLPETSDFRYGAERNGYMEKFYSITGAETYAENRPWASIFERDTE